MIFMQFPRPGDQPGPRPTLPAGGRFLTLQRPAAMEVDPTINQDAQVLRSAHPGSTTVRSDRPVFRMTRSVCAPLSTGNAHA